MRSRDVFVQRVAFLSGAVLTALSCLYYICCFINIHINIYIRIRNVPGPGICKATGQSIYEGT